LGSIIFLKKLRILSARIKFEKPRVNEHFI